MYLSLVVLVCSDGLAHLGIKHTALTRNEILNVLDVRLGEAFVLRVDLYVMSDHAASRFHDASQSARIVQISPTVWCPCNLIRNQSTGENTMRQTIAAVTCDNVGVFPALVLADEGHV